MFIGAALAPATGLSSVGIREPGVLMKDDMSEWNVFMSSVRTVSMLTPPLL